MILYQGSTLIHRSEQLFTSAEQEVSRVVLKAGDGLARHQVNKTVVVVPIRGKIHFFGEDHDAILTPGSIVRMLPNEPHHLDAIEDSEFMVIKSALAITES